MPPDGSALARTPRAQFEHYVPKVYLRPFVAEEQGKESIYRFDKSSGEIDLKNIAKVAGARDFYEIQGVLALGGIEKYLGKLESNFGPVRDKILAAEDVTGITGDERRVVAYFVATQFVRTQEIRKGIVDMIGSTKDYLAGRKVSDELRRQIEEAKSESKIKDVHLSLLDMVPWIAGTLMERKWIVIVNETEMPFWTSDHPVDLRNEIDPPGIANFGIGRPEMQVFLPLSPTLSLLICDYRYYIYEPDKFVTRDVINNNVIFQNDWQLRQATRFIFSNKDDFFLAHLIIMDVPEIVDPARRRVSVRSWRPSL